MSAPQLPATLDALRLCLDRLLADLRRGVGPNLVLRSPAAAELNRVAEALGYGRPVELDHLVRGRPDRLGRTWRPADPSVVEAVEAVILDPFDRSGFRRVRLGTGVCGTRSGGASHEAQSRVEAAAEVEHELVAWADFLRLQETAAGPGSAAHAGAGPGGNDDRDSARGSEEAVGPDRCTLPDARDLPPAAPAGTPPPVADAYAAVYGVLVEAAALRNGNSPGPIVADLAPGLAAELAEADGLYRAAESLLLAACERNGGCAFADALAFARAVSDHAGHVALGGDAPDDYLRAVPAVDAAAIIMRMRNQAARAVNLLRTPSADQPAPAPAAPPAGDPVALGGGEPAPPTELVCGAIRARLEEFLAFVPGPPPAAGPGQTPESAVATWCKQFGSANLRAVGESWAGQLAALGDAVWGAGLGPAARAGRPPEEPDPMGLSVHGMAERAHVALRVAVDKAEGEDIGRQVRRQLAVGRVPAATDRERAAELVVSFGQVAEGLTNLFCVDAATFAAFTTALTERVEAILRDGGGLPVVERPADVAAAAPPDPDDGREVTDTDRTAQARFGAPASGRGFREPKKEALIAYRYKVATGAKQAEVAERLTREFGRPVHQGTVCRWLKDVRRWLKAGNVLPDLTPEVGPKPMPLNPSAIDMGRHAEGRPEGQRRRATDD